MMGVPVKYQVRKKLRLDGYDYSQPGGYFITTNVINPDVLLSTVKQSQIFLTPYGQIVEDCWLALPRHYPNITLDEFCVMPEHFHGILIINDPGSGGSTTLARTNNSQPISPGRMHKRQGEARHYTKCTLSEIVRGFKSFSSRKINAIRNVAGQCIWQRSFYDRIIRDETALNSIREYIIANPLNWDKLER